jgi:hypothetical protein
LVNR